MHIIFMTLITAVLSKKNTQHLLEVHHTAAFVVNRIHLC